MSKWLTLEQAAAITGDPPAIYRALYTERVVPGVRKAANGELHFDESFVRDMKARGGLYDKAGPYVTRIQKGGINV